VSPVPGDRAVGVHALADDRLDSGKRVSLPPIRVVVARLRDPRDSNVDGVSLVRGVVFLVSVRLAEGAQVDERHEVSFWLFV
jgi:hypothetical protein